MKKWCFLLVGVFLMLSLVGCTVQGERETDIPQPSSGTAEDVQMPELPDGNSEQSPEAEPSPSESQGTVPFRNPVGVLYSNGEYSYPPAYNDPHHDDDHHE